MGGRFDGWNGRAKEHCTVGETAVSDGGLWRHICDLKTVLCVIEVMKCDSSKRDMVAEVFEAYFRELKTQARRGSAFHEARGNYSMTEL